MKNNSFLESGDYILFTDSWHPTINPSSRMPIHHMRYWVQFCMLYSACELHPFLMPACKKPKQNTYLEFQEYLKIQLQIG